MCASRRGARGGGRGRGGGRVLNCLVLLSACPCVLPLSLSACKLRQLSIRDAVFVVIVTAVGRT